MTDTRTKSPKRSVHPAKFSFIINTAHCPKQPWSLCPHGMPTLSYSIFIPYPCPGLLSLPLLWPQVNQIRNNHFPKKWIWRKGLFFFLSNTWEMSSHGLLARTNGHSQEMVKGKMPKSLCKCNKRLTYFIYKKPLQIMRWNYEYVMDEKRCEERIHRRKKCK